MKSKLFKLILTLGIVFTSIFALTSLQADAAAGRVYGAQSGRVYLRTSPGSSSYVALVNNGTYIDTSYSQSGYTKCYVPGVGTGWITSSYVYRRAYISGASSGKVYVWSSAYGQGSKGTIYNGSTVYVKTSTSNGRHQGYYNGVPGWFTSKFVYYY